jgi:ElaB/YqjD/DUF883 family membrane-anchored ribosome-binding protein
MGNGYRSTTMTNAGTDKFFAELKAALEHAEELLHSTAGDLGETREKARDKLREASECMGAIERELLSEARAKAQAANDYVHGNPWRSIAIAGGIAFVVGLLLGRRR